MIVEFRTYTVAHGQMDEYLRRFEVEGLPLLTKHLGSYLGCYISDAGTLNQVRHVWLFESYADREARRQNLESDADWQTFKIGNRGTFVHQDVCITKPAKFMALQGFPWEPSRCN